MSKTRKYYAMLERRITVNVIENAYLSHPSPNDDGLIDYYVENMGKFESLCSINVESYEEAENYFIKNYPTIWKRDLCQITLRII